MEDRLNNWISNLHIALILFPAIPVLFNIRWQAWIALVVIGLLLLIQCYQYVAINNMQEQEHQNTYKVCIVSKIILLTLYLILTGYWYFSPLYYIIINPRSKSESKASYVVSFFGVILAWNGELSSVSELPWLILAFAYVVLVTKLIHIIHRAAQGMILREHMLAEQMKLSAINELKINKLNRELAIKYQLADTNARLEEREKISRNIHNVVGHTITSAIVSLQAYNVLNEIEPQRAKEKLSAATDRMRLALEEIRRAVRVLDQETQEISMKDFSNLLITELMRFSEDTGIDISHNLDYMDMEQLIDKRYCEFLHSSLTECISNGIRHGKATSFYVFMQCDAQSIELSITDNGCGFDNISKEEQERRIRQGYGIRKMEQFIVDHGGRMKLSSDNGFRVQIELPFFHG